MEHQTHFFFAVKIPDETKLLMNRHILKLKERLPFDRWVHFEDLHITLAFLGAAPAGQLAAADKNVIEALKDLKAFPLKIHNLGIFGVQNSPRVFWADTLESEALKQLRTKVFSACEEAGVKLETRPFRPHITLARKWAGEQPFQQKQLNIWNELQPEPLSCQVSEVVLYQTHLHKVPKYEAIKSYPLLT